MIVVVLVSSEYCALFISSTLDMFCGWEGKKRLTDRPDSSPALRNLRSGVLFPVEREIIATPESAVGKGEKKEPLIAG